MTRPRCKKMLTLPLLSAYIMSFINWTNIFILVQVVSLILVIVQNRLNYGNKSHNMAFVCMVINALQSPSSVAAPNFLHIQTLWLARPGQLGQGASGKIRACVGPVLDNQSRADIFNNYSSLPHGLWVNSPWGRRRNGLLTQRPWGREE